MSDKDDIKDAIEAFDRAAEADSDNRKAWIEDFKFARLGEQWSDAERRQREQDGRPTLTLNKLPAFIRQVTNDARQNKPSLKFHPVGDGADQDTAGILDGLARNIEYTSSADVAYDTALDHAVTGGYGYWRVNTDYAQEDTFDQDIVIEPITNPLSVYRDPRSTAADSSDWNEAFVTDLMTKEEFQKRWKGADVSDFDSKDQKVARWFQGDEVQVAEWWTRDDVPMTIVKLSSGIVLDEAVYLKNKDLWDVQGVEVTGTRASTRKKVTQRIISGCQTLETNAWAGKFIPLIPVFGDDLHIEGKRHFISLIRFAKDPQRMVNYWRTTGTEVVALQPKAPWVGPKGAFDSDAQRWGSANTKNHAYLEYDGQEPPQRQPFAGMPAGVLQEALNANDDMKSIMGIYDASLGARSNETSGRAIMARQREGDVSTFNFIDNLSRAIRHQGRVILDLIPRVYNAPRIIRVIHEDGTNKMVPINQQFDPRALQAQQQQEAADLQEEIKQVSKIYDLTAGKYDVTCEVGPSYTTKREEAAAQMTEFMRAVPGAAPLIGDLLAKNLDWPGADEIAKRLRAALPPNLQGPNPQAMALQQQLQQQDQQAREAVGTLQQQLAQTQQELQALKTDKSLDAAKAQTDQFKAETDRRKAEVEIAKTVAETTPPGEQQLAPLVQAIQEQGAVLQQLVAYIQAPAEIVRGEDGMPTGIKKGGIVREIVTGPDGQPIGVQ